MAPYWFLFAAWAAGAVQFARKGAIAFERMFFILLCAITVAFIGLRLEVGGDWFNYLSIYEGIAFQPLGTALTLSDPGYALFNWISAQVDWGIGPVNLACAAIFMAGLAKLAMRQPNPWLAILVAMPYLIIVVAMGYTRQAAAIGMVCFAIADASERNIARLVIYVSIGALFHKTAILMLPILLMPVLRRNLLLGLLGGLVFLGLFAFFLRNSSDQLMANYVQGDYNSQGAATRIAMNVVAAILLVLLRDRLGFLPFQKSFWIASSILSILSVVVLVVASASSGVDRMALFILPLQVVTFSRLPYALSRSRAPLPSILISVIIYSFLVQFVWLFYADNAGSWLPYRNMLFSYSSSA